MADTHDLLFELGTEELPPNALLSLRKALQENIVAGLQKSGLKYRQIKAFATPRRLAVSIQNLATRQPDQTVERRGPALQAAYQPDGTPTRATEGFAKSCHAGLDQLSVVRTDKGEWLCFKRFIKGVAAEQLIPDILRQSLAALPVPKRMRWGTGSAEFARPVRWAVLLFGDEVLGIEVLGVITGRLTYGHRFHHPLPIALTNPAEYAERLYAEGKVIVSPEDRKDIIAVLAQQAAMAVGGTAHIELELLDEVAALVEWPSPITGSFDERYLSLPQEVLMTTLQTHQKYFPIKDAADKLLPYFITFSNIESRDSDVIRRGNERVIRPRLADAEFFWAQDRKKTLESRIPALSGITFQKTLGSLLSKTRRVQRLAVYIAQALSAESALVERAALLAKADLLTEMVGEFPTLQGTMGRYYALAEGEPAEVAIAIEEQYLPKVSGGPLPETLAGQMLALAEKFDTLCGIFSVGLLPTGDSDPYALRRAALGAVRILVEEKLELSVPALVERATAPLEHAFDREAIRQAVYEFILDRFKGYCLEQGYSADEFEAVLAVRPAVLLDFARRLAAVKQFRDLEAAASLAAANKRICNILRKAEENVVGNVDIAFLTAAEESALFAEIRQAKQDALPRLQRGDYTAALCRLAALRGPVDAFFDHVLVMTDDAALRQNRLGLLAMIRDLFLQIADVSKLQLVS